MPSDGHVRCAPAGSEESIDLIRVSKEQSEQAEPGWPTRQPLTNHELDLLQDGLLKETGMRRSRSSSSSRVPAWRVAALAQAAHRRDSMLPTVVEVHGSESCNRPAEDVYSTRHFELRLEGKGWHQSRMTCRWHRRPAAASHPSASPRVLADVQRRWLDAAMGGDEEIELLRADALAALLTKHHGKTVEGRARLDDGATVVQAHVRGLCARNAHGEHVTVALLALRTRTKWRTCFYSCLAMDILRRWVSRRRFRVKICAFRVAYYNRVTRQLARHWLERTRRCKVCVGLCMDCRVEVSRLEIVRQNSGFFANLFGQPGHFVRLHLSIATSRVTLDAAIVRTDPHLLLGPAQEKPSQSVRNSLHICDPAEDDVQAPCSIESINAIIDESVPAVTPNIILTTDVGQDGFVSLELAAAQVEEMPSQKEVPAAADAPCENLLLTAPEAKLLTVAIPVDNKEVAQVASFTSLEQKKEEQLKDGNSPAMSPERTDQGHLSADRSPSNEDGAGSQDDGIGKGLGPNHKTEDETGQETTDTLVNDKDGQGGQHMPTSERGSPNAKPTPKLPTKPARNPPAKFLSLATPPSSSPLLTNRSRSFYLEPPDICTDDYGGGAMLAALAALAELGEGDLRGMSTRKLLRRQKRPHSSSLKLISQDQPLLSLPQRPHNGHLKPRHLHLTRVDDSSTPEDGSDDLSSCDGSPSCFAVPRHRPSSRALEQMIPVTDGGAWPRPCALLEHMIPSSVLEAGMAQRTHLISMRAPWTAALETSLISDREAICNTGSYSSERCRASEGLFTSSYIPSHPRQRGASYTSAGEKTNAYMHLQEQPYHGQLFQRI